MEQVVAEKTRKQRNFEKAAKAAEYGKSAAQLTSTTAPLLKVFGKKLPAGIGSAIYAFETVEKASKAASEGNHTKAMNEVLAGGTAAVGAFFLPGGGILGRETVRAMMKESGREQDAPDMSSEREFVSGLLGGKKEKDKKALDGVSAKEAMDKAAPKHDDVLTPGFHGMFSMRAASGKAVPVAEDADFAAKRKREAAAREAPSSAPTPPLN